MLEVNQVYISYKVTPDCCRAALGIFHSLWQRLQHKYTLDSQLQCRTSGDTAREIDNYMYSTSAYAVSHPAQRTNLFSTTTPPIQWYSDPPHSILSTSVTHYATWLTVRPFQFTTAQLRVVPGSQNNGVFCGVLRTNSHYFPGQV